MSWETRRYSHDHVTVGKLSNSSDFTLFVMTARSSNVTTDRYCWRATHLGAKMTSLKQCSCQMSETTTRQLRQTRSNFNNSWKVKYCNTCFSRAGLKLSIVAECTLLQIESWRSGKSLLPISVHAFKASSWAIKVTRSSSRFFTSPFIFAFHNSMVQVSACRNQFNVSLKYTLFIKFNKGIKEARSTSCRVLWRDAFVINFAKLVSVREFSFQWINCRPCVWRNDTSGRIASLVLSNSSPLWLKPDSSPSNGDSFQSNEQLSFEWHCASVFLMCQGCQSRSWLSLSAPFTCNNLYSSILKKW